MNMNKLLFTKSKNPKNNLNNPTSKSNSRSNIDANMDQIFEAYDIELKNKVFEAAIAAVGEEKSKQLKFLDLTFENGMVWSYDVVKQRGVKLEERAESCVDSGSRFNFGENLDNVSYFWGVFECRDMYS